MCNLDNNYITYATEKTDLNLFRGACCSEDETLSVCLDEAAGGIKGNICSPSFQNLKNNYYAFCPRPPAITNCGTLKLNPEKKT